MDPLLIAAGEEGNVGVAEVVGTHRFADR